MAENPQRPEVGLRIIDPSWICFRSIDGKDEWLTDPVKDQAAVKVIGRDKNGMPLWETDSYLSGKRVTPDESLVNEQMQVVYDYNTKKLEISYIGVDEQIESWIEVAGTNNQSCLEVVDRIKKKWGQ